MPYELRGNCVHKQGESEPLKCYDNHADALAYLRALEANVTDANKQIKSMMMLTQAETNYNAAGGKVNKACSNCRWFCPVGDMEEAHCHLVEEEPAPIVSNGLCDRWESVPVPETPAPEPVPVMIVEPPEMDDMMKAVDNPTVIERIWQRIKERMQGDKQDSAFTVFKGSDDQYYWHAVFTNNFEDREGEILSAKAHERYEQRVNMGLVPMPQLWAWHTKGTEHGQADVVWFNNHFMHAIGHFTGDVEKHVKFYQKNPVKLSHGFTSPEWAFKDGVFDDYNTFEITTLPPRAAANVYTSFEDIKEMPLTEAKRQWIEAQFGKDKLAEIEAADENRAKSLEELKITYKDYANPTPETAKPVESDKALTAVYTDLVATQDELLNIAQAQAEIIKGYEKRIAAQDSQIAALAKAVNTREAPSKSEATVATAEIADLFKQKLPTAPNPKSEFYGGLVKAEGV